MRKPLPRLPLLLLLQGILNLFGIPDGQHLLRGRLGQVGDRGRGDLPDRRTGFGAHQLRRHDLTRASVGTAESCEAADEHGLLVVTEVMEIAQIEGMIPYVDLFQLGARNMQNFNLLRELGNTRTPVLMKRGIAATIEEVLLSAEYILSGGNYDLMLCERGIRTYETYTRNTMDISAIPVLKKLTHLPIIADPSHGVGIRDLVPPMALASVAAGADGLIMEMHPNPDKAMSDGAQSLYPEQLTKLVAQLRQLAPVVGRTVA